MMICKRIGGCIAFAAAALSGGAHAFSGGATSGQSRSRVTSSDDVHSRREIIDIFAKAVTIGTALTIPSANALDMDSFEKSLIEKDTTQCDSKQDRKCIPKLTADEALCKYGVSGADSRTEACRRVRDSGGQLPTSKPGERMTMGWLNGDIAL
ncbi:hypothetical protein ACHAXR_006371 [Thalassiosira sp. AJA248-18]